TDRKNVYIVYLKESEAILELLALIGVEESLLQAFESARNLKEIRNQVNRLVNCETANLQRTINAAMKQIENINLLIKYDEYDELPKVLKQTANLRLNNPEASLTELAELLNCSRSAINHRMRKIDALAMQIRKDNSIKE
ncbi:MAG TPA: DNA-binding protein WhiA, partial [Megamonas funiformis]|nr:DNA-binding protein WhiA [Megamonas funiformis]